MTESVAEIVTCRKSEESDEIILLPPLPSLCLPSFLLLPPLSPSSSFFSFLSPLSPSLCLLARQLPLHLFLHLPFTSGQCLGEAAAQGVAE